MPVKMIVKTVLWTLLLVFLTVFVYDYQTVRVAAAKGAASYEFLDKLIAQQKAAAVPTPPQEMKK